MMISLRRLLHNRVELLLAFVVPIAFFSVFALIFGKGIGSGSTPRIKVVVVDESNTSTSTELSQSLRENDGLRVMRADSGQKLTRAQAERLVRSGSVTLAIVLQSKDSDQQPITAQLLTDASDQVAGQVVSALVGRSLMMTQAKHRMAALQRDEEMALQSMPAIDFSQLPTSDQAANPTAEPQESQPRDTEPRDTEESSPTPPRPLQATPTNVSPMRPSTTLQQRGNPTSEPIRQPTEDSPENPSPETDTERPWQSLRPTELTSNSTRTGNSTPLGDIAPASYNAPAEGGAIDDIGRPEISTGPGSQFTGDTDLLSQSPVEIVDVIGDQKSNPVVSMYAAGIAVMFLLFGSTSGGGALLEERENQTLDRLLSTQLTMDQLILGKWFYLTLLGIVQVSVMFAWGQLVFGVNVIGHWDGFLMMTTVTSFAAAAFGLMLATLCKTRGQLNGLSVILILTMSALGGSMVPRYVMSQQMRDVGLWTFNAWALDGYDKVFWRELPVSTLWPQLVVLTLCGVAFLVIARLLAIRWQRD
ncbi:ABC transporter permease [Stieleria varia]